METGAAALTAMKKVYAELITGGEEMRENFEKAIDAGHIGGRLKDREQYQQGAFCSTFCRRVKADMIPEYIKKAWRKSQN